jgi:MtfA peptidase
MFHWLRERARKQVLETPFPAAWREALPQWLPVTLRLPEERREQFERLVQLFVAEKNWTPAGGLELDDEMRVTIAGYACLLVLGLPDFLYENVETIIVYPSAVRAPLREGSIFRQALDPVSDQRPVLLGEAHVHGPVIVVWDSVRRARHPERGHNVVFHEFAHQLDMLDGRADGAPPLHSRSDYARFSEVCQTEFAALRAAVERGFPSFLDPYGATNEAEFFAVATEFFFDVPRELKQHHSELYGVLEQFYRQDPAAW